MTIRVDIHPTTKTAAIVAGIGLAIVLMVFGAKQLFESPSAPDVSREHTPFTTTGTILSFESSTAPLVPIVELTIADAARESSWSQALAAVLGASTEVSVEGGRVDVLADCYAIEVDRLDKWHEAIGQAAHYGLKSNRTPVAALMIPSDLWPLNATTRDKLQLIDETCTRQGIKLVLLRRR